jgi:hypothetical protein
LIEPRAYLGAKPIRWAKLLLRIPRQACLVDLAVLLRAQPPTIDCVKQADSGDIGSTRKADQRLHWHVEARVVAPIIQIGTAGTALVSLLDLVTIDGIVFEKSKIIVLRQIVEKPPRLSIERLALIRVTVDKVQIVAICVSSLAWIDTVEAAEDAPRISG